MISVIMMQFNNAQLTVDAIESFRAHVHCPHEIILIDNGSVEPGACEAIGRIPEVALLKNPINEGFGRANNIAARHARGEMFLFLNNDTVTRSDFVSPMLELFEDNPEIGIAGPRILNADGSLQLSAGRGVSFLQELRDKFFYAGVENNNAFMKRLAENRSTGRAYVDWVTGAAMFMRADVFRSVGGFDEDYFLYFEDKDMCARVLSHGMQIVYNPLVSVVHLRGGSRNTAPNAQIDKYYRESQQRYYEKHRPRWEQRFLRFYLKLSGKYVG